MAGSHVHCACMLPGADPERVVAFGSSMGGGNALAAASTWRRGAARRAAAARGRHLPAVGQPDEPALINAPGGEEADRLAMPGPAIAAARRAPQGELHTYAGVDHFDIYDGPVRDALVADQL